MAKARIGKLPPRYSFILNQVLDLEVNLGGGIRQSRNEYSIRWHARGKFVAKLNSTIRTYIAEGVAPLAPVDCLKPHC